MIKKIWNSKQGLIITAIWFIAVIIGLFCVAYKIENSQEIHAKEDLTSIIDSNESYTSLTSELFEYTYVEEEQRYLINDTSSDYIQTDITNTREKLTVYMQYYDNNPNLNGIQIKRIDLTYSNYHTRTKTQITLNYKDFIASGKDIGDITEMLENVRSSDLIDIISELD